MPKGTEAKGSMLRVGVLGACGKMGRTVCEAVEAAPDLELAVVVDPAGGVVLGREVASETSALSGVDVAVDFTVAESARRNIEFSIENGIHTIVGTTGLTAQDLARFEQLLADHSDVSSVFIAPNFAIGAVLMMHFSEIAARWMRDAEIVELHHPGKLDAPSGTALRTAEGIQRGRESSDPVPIHSVRLPGFVAHQEVIFGAEGQTLSIRHDSIDRTSFMPGLLLAIRRAHELRGLVVGLDRLLDL